MGGIKALLTAGLIAAVLGCVPKVERGKIMYLHNDADVLMSSQDYNELISDMESAGNFLMNSNLKQKNLAGLYLRSIGVDFTSLDNMDEEVYNKVIDILVLSAFNRQTQSNISVNNIGLKETIKNNSLIVDNSCGGLLLTNNGYFATSYHCVDDILKNAANSKIRLGNQTFDIEAIVAFDPDHDLALGKADKKTTLVEPIRVRIVPPAKRMDIELYSLAMGFWQMGRVTSVSDDATYGRGRHNLDSFITDAHVVGGFSGTPVISMKGELVGFAACGEVVEGSKIDDNMCVSNAKYLIPMINKYIEKQISELRAKYN